MTDVTHNPKSTCEDCRSIVADESRQGVTEVVMEAPVLPSGPARSDNRVLAGRVRDRKAEAAMQKLRYSLGLPSVGKSAEVIRKRVAGFRRALEAEVVAARGEISLADACAINTACAGERHSSLAAAEIRRNGDAMKPAEKLAYMTAMLSGAQTRDRAVEKLRLTPSDGNDLAALYSDLAREAPQKSAQATQGANVAPNSLEHGDASPAFPNASGEVQR